MDTPQLVCIEWVDSRQPTAAWRRVNDLDYLSECRCTSVGFLLRETADAKILAVSVADEGDEMQATGVYVIPTAAVLSVKLLTASSRVAQRRAVSVFRRDRVVRAQFAPWYVNAHIAFFVLSARSAP